MKKKAIISIVGLLAIFGVVYYSIACYVLVKSDIDTLIVACLEPESTRLPPGLPEFYLFNFRGNKADIELLSKTVGLGFVLGPNKKSKEEVLKYASFLLDKGIKINAIGFDGFAALHRVILDNQPEYAAFLLEHGADINVKVGHSRVHGKEEKNNFFGMSPIDLANLISKTDNKDRSQIIKMMDKVQSGQDVDAHH